MQIGQLVGNYRVMRPLGSGGMGAVFEVLHEQIGKRAAIKVLHPHLSADPQIAARFLNEARAVNIVDHPGMVEIFEFGRLPDGTTFIVMELLKGESLRSRLARVGRLQPEEALRLGRQVAATLAAAHERAIIHRDLKPDNVFIVPDPEAPGGERAKVLDFGIAKVMDPLGEPSQVKTQTGIMMGTPVYMAPEQFRGAAAVDDRADVYALGVILYQALAGQLPFAGQTLGDLVVQHIQVPPPPLGGVDPSLPAPVCALVHAMLEKDPAARPSMAACVTTIERLGVGSTPGAPAPAPPGQAPGPSPSWPSAHLTPTPTPAPAPGPSWPSAGPSTLGQAAAQAGPRQVRSPLRWALPAVGALGLAAGVLAITLSRRGGEGPRPPALLHGQDPGRQAPSPSGSAVAPPPTPSPSAGGLLGKVMRAARSARPGPGGDGLRRRLSLCSERVHDSEQRYLSWADASRGPTGGEKVIYGLYSLSESCRGDAGASGEGVEDAYEAKLAGMYTLLSETERYYERKEYKDDRMARGRELHPRLLAAFADFNGAHRALLREALRAEEEELRGEPGGLRALAREVVRAGGRPLEEVDLGRLTEAVGAFQRAADAAPPADPFARGSVEKLAVAGRELVHRLRDHERINGVQRGWLGTSAGWMVEGSPDKLISAYNDYAGHAGLVVYCRHYRSSHWRAAGAD
jgi:serine/threonine-protein kinase